MTRAYREKMDTALLIIDIQNDYFPGGANPLVEADKAAANASKMIDFFRAKGLPVIFIQHFSNSPDSKFFAPGTPGVEFAYGVRPHQGEKIIPKHFPNAFRETSLHEYLQTTGIKRLVICGMMTHMCVDSTVRAAKDLGYECQVIGDACATCDLAHWGKYVNAKDINNSFLAALAYYYAGIVKAAEYVAKNS
jgi:nicotinamidase-related amidase